jgi:phosphoserine phosphatase
MRYKAIIFDIDGTIVRHISSWRYIHEKLKLWNEVAHRYQDAFLAGKIDYRRFCELDAAHWKGLPEKKIKEIFQGAPLAKNAAIYIKRLKRKGFKLIAISTGLQYLADRLKKELGFDYVVSNRLIASRGILTGRVKINLEHGAKGEILKAIIKRFGLRPSQVISVGDSAGDIPLAKASGYSIAFNSSDEEFSKAVDYNCKTKDFKELFDKILAITTYRSTIISSETD